MEENRVNTKAMDDIAMLIQRKANGRKIVLRWKSRENEF